jgi:hypothetical protein
MGALARQRSVFSGAQPSRGHRTCPARFALQFTPDQAGFDCQLSDWQDAGRDQIAALKEVDWPVCIASVAADDEDVAAGALRCVLRPSPFHYMPPFA